MNSSQISTYAHYKTLYTSRDITKNDIVNVCNELKQSYLTNHLGFQEFEPEPISEGGIRFKLYNGEDNGPYKTIRFLLNTSWPSIDDEWKTGDAEVVINKNNRIDLFLKAFDGAPKWTTEEKAIFQRTLTNNGFVSSKRGLKIPI